MSQSEPVQRLTLLPLPPASLPSASCIYFLMIVFWEAACRRSTPVMCAGSVLTRGSKGEGAREETWNRRRPQSSQERVYRTSLCAAMNGDIKVNSVLADSDELFLLITRINRLSVFTRMTGNDARVSFWVHPRDHYVEVTLGGTHFAYRFRLFNITSSSLELLAPAETI